MLCPQCGKTLVDSNMVGLCPDCRASDDNFENEPCTDGGEQNESKPSPTPRRTPEESQAIEDAGLWLRYFAYVADRALIGAVLFFLYLFFADEFVKPTVDYLFYDRPLWGSLRPLSLDPAAVNKARFLGYVQSALIVFYHCLFESLSGHSTPGKWLFGLQVRQESGKETRLSYTVFRNLSRLLIPFTLGIGYLMAAFTRRKQGLHDKIACCRVVRKSPMTFGGYIARVLTVVFLIVVLSVAQLFIAKAVIYAKIPKFAEFTEEERNRGNQLATAGVNPDSNVSNLREPSFKKQRTVSNSASIQLGQVKLNAASTMAFIDRSQMQVELLFFQYRLSPRARDAIYNLPDRSTKEVGKASMQRLLARATLQFSELNCSLESTKSITFDVYSNPELKKEYNKFPLKIEATDKKLSEALKTINCSELKRGKPLNLSFGLNQSLKGSKKEFSGNISGSFLLR